MPYPYATTLQGLKDVLLQLRSNFPPIVDAAMLKKWSIAPGNEGTVLKVLRFIGIIDDDGNKQDETSKVFVEHDDEAFGSKFADLVQDSYAELFHTWGDKAWSLERDQLIQFFRTEDQTSARAGKQQAATFELLAQFAGHGSALPEPTPAEKRANNSSPKRKTSKSKKSSKAETNEVGAPVTPRAPAKPGAPSFTVRVEINLPVSEDQAVYDRIFRSIKENLYP